MITICITANNEITIQGNGYSHVEFSGFEHGIRSRIQPATCAVYTEGEQKACTVTGHMLGNQPFYVVEATGAAGTVKLSQEMTNMVIDYCISGNGFKLDGSFSTGSFSILHKGEPATTVQASKDGSTIQVALDIKDTAYAHWLTGLAVATALMVHKLNPTPAE
ncbi:hypothetical protein K6V98_03740 [Collinsella sp. AGMB00827]|uniref:Uncharacterized protein n=1 Tax=Collinsella ureilytica TaxID=2869515 RepID=A0ABS7MJC1_9ACTN|nr:hypothetical protein [Collinsella urealyticum]MBY4797469.1 hypothetical protein [Collinsella urealyticum]